LSPAEQPPPDGPKRPHRARGTTHDAVQQTGQDTEPGAAQAGAQDVPAGAVADTAPDPPPAPTPESQPHATHAHAPHAHTPKHRKPHAEIAHATRGRVRIKIPAAKSNPTLLDQIKAAFEGHPGIDAIDIKQSTRSVIIYYDPEHHPDTPSLFASMDRTAAAPMAEIAPLSAAASPPAPERHRPTNKLDAEINSITEEAEFLAEHSHAARSIVEYVKGLDRQLKRATNNNIDLKILAPVGLAAFTFLEIGAAAATPMWVTLVIFSLNHFVELHAHDADQDQS